MPAFAATFRASAEGETSHSLAQRLIVAWPLCVARAHTTQTLGTVDVTRAWCCAASNLKADAPSGVGRLGNPQDISMCSIFERSRLQSHICVGRRGHRGRGSRGRPPPCHVRRPKTGVKCEATHTKGV